MPLRHPRVHQCSHNVYDLLSSPHKQCFIHVRCISREVDMVYPTSPTLSVPRSPNELDITLIKVE